jgi:phage shock protein A
MGIFSKIKGGISSKANAALDKAIDPEKELEMAILELEEGRKKALAELVSYKATAKTMDMDMEKQKTKAAEWERRAMIALRAGDENAAREALKQKKACEVEASKIERDKHEAASYAIQLNKSRKEFETKLTMLKLRKGTLATQIASARSASGNAFGHDNSVWDKFKAAEERIDQEAIETEVDASMRGEESDAMLFDAKLAKLSEGSGNAGMLPSGDGSDPLAALKDKMAADKAAKQKQLAAAAPAASKAEPKPDAKALPSKTDAKPSSTPEAKPASNPVTRPAATVPSTPVAKAAATTTPKADATAAKAESLPAAKAAGNAGATSAAKADANPDATPEPPRPEVKIDTSKVEAELAALRAALAKGELDDK